MCFSVYHKEILFFPPNRWEIKEVTLMMEKKRNILRQKIKKYFKLICQIF